MRTARRIAAGAGLFVLLALLTFALPIKEWRTGELAAPPLPVVKGGPPITLARRVWVDTDAACGAGRTTDPDDCYAILLLARSPGIELVGISTVAGNAPLPETDRITRELMARVALEAETSVPVHRSCPRHWCRTMPRGS